MFTVCALVFRSKYVQFPIICSLQYSININTVEVDPHSDLLHICILKCKNTTMISTFRAFSTKGLLSKRRRFHYIYIFRYGSCNSFTRQQFIVISTNAAIHRSTHYIFLLLLLCRRIVRSGYLMVRLLAEEATRTC